MNSLNEYVKYLSMLEQYKNYKNNPCNSSFFNYDFAIDTSELKTYMPKLSLNNFENDWEHFKNILKWVKTNLPHDGYNNSNVPYDAISIIKFMKNKQIGPSCMMLSFALRDILGLYGYYARVVQTCPFDPRILDSHWKVLAYSNHFEKWVMLDPSWCAYCLTDDIPLSIQEIRTMLIKREKFDIINHSGFSKAHYHYLLCRYYFHFNSFIFNETGMFEKSDQRRINLSPEGFNANDYFNERWHLEEPDMKKWMKVILARFHENTSYINDEEAFWQIPPECLETSNKNRLQV